jgi:hypothetical protein
MVKQSQVLCPYLERRDARCAGMLTLTNLRAALAQCAGEHEYCAVYHQIRLADRPRERARAAVACSA